VWIPIAAVLLGLLASGCGQGEPTSLVEQGRRAYLANCIACHNPDPAREGTLGPAIACSSRELIEARVLRAQYPPGYSPKRDSKLMPAQPFLQADVPALAAFLACPAAGAR
jgi:mono/diheme cytochrome c family protein